MEINDQYSRIFFSLHVFVVIVLVVFLLFLYCFVPCFVFAMLSRLLLLPCGYLKEKGCFLGSCL